MIIAPTFTALQEVKGQKIWEVWGSGRTGQSCFWNLKLIISRVELFSCQWLHFDLEKSFSKSSAYPKLQCIAQGVVIKGPISSEKYWYYFHCPKNVLCSILSFVFWIFPPLDTAVQLESADSKQNAISKSLFQDSFQHIFWAMRKMHHTFWKKATFSNNSRKKLHHRYTYVLSCNMMPCTSLVIHIWSRQVWG